jgi:DNA-binding LytR/AlgR family response regulator
MTEGNGPSPRPAEPWQDAALGFVYWLALVLVLEPGNIARAFESGGQLPVGEEIARLFGAASLGSVATLAVFALVRRYPAEGENLARRALFHALADAVIAIAMIVVAGILASFLLSEEHRSFLLALGSQLAVDGPILIFCLVVLTVIAHAIRNLRIRRAQATAKAGYLATVPVKSRNKTEIVSLAEVCWIETQGNYLALHVRDATHLIRETSRNFEARIDPERFLRIHRQTIVAVDAIRRVEALASGDATIFLTDGAELRASRNYRDALRTRLSADRMS